MKSGNRKKPVIRFRKMTTRLVLSYFAACFIPLVILTGIIYGFSARELHQSALEFAEIYTSQLRDNLDAQYDEYDRITRSILYDKDILNALTRADTSTVADRAELKYQLRRLLMKVKTLQPRLCNVMFLTADGEVMTYNDRALLLMTVISVILSRSVSRPIQVIRRQMLEAERGNYQVISFRGGTEETEELIESYNHMILQMNPDIVITDISMPEMNGLEMIRYLKEEGSGARFILISGYSDFDYARQAISLGVEDYITKPIEEKDLTAVIETVCRRIDSDWARTQQDRRMRDYLHREAGDGGAEKEQDLIEEIRAYIREHYTEEISLKEISERFFINASYFSTLFKKKTGQTYQAYVISLRIAMARQLLQEEDMRIYEICSLVGYSDINHFNRIFERETGMRPSEYRKTFREKKGGARHTAGS